MKKHSELEYARVGPGDATPAPTRRRRPWFARIFGRRNGASKEAIAEQAQEKEPVAVEAAATETLDPNKTSPATLTRYVLASTAVALVGCNIYLFVSQ